MGWFTEKFSNGLPMNNSNINPAQAEQSFEATAERVWGQMKAGFEADINEINTHEGDADFKELADHECRLSSAAMKIAVIVTADLAARTIQYAYEPEDARIAVPEHGVLSMRPSKSGIELYSADERLSPDQARRLILEPLFFANPPLEATGT